MNDKTEITSNPVVSVWLTLVWQKASAIMGLTTVIIVSGILFAAAAGVIALTLLYLLERTLS